MKKVLKLFIILLFISFVNVKAFTVGDKVKMTSIEKTKSTSMRWAAGGTLETYTYMVDAKYGSYCINAHLNDVKENKDLMVEAVLGQDSNKYGAVSQGFYTIFKEYNNGKGGYAKEEFISALRVYAQLQGTFSAGNIDCKDVEDNKCLTRQQMYKHYANLAYEIGKDIKGYNGAKSSPYNSSFTFTYSNDTTKTNIKKLVQAGYDAFKNYKASKSSTPSVKFTESAFSEDGSSVMYEIELNNFSKTGNLIINKIDGATSFELYSDEKLENKIKPGDKVSAKNNSKVYLIIQLDETTKENYNNKNIIVSYLIDDANSYNGAIFCSPDSNGKCIKTRQRYIYIDFDNSEKTETLGNSGSPETNPCDKYPVGSEEYLCCKHPELCPEDDNCDVYDKGSEEYICCMDPNKCKPAGGCDPTQYNCDASDCTNDIDLSKLNTDCSKNNNGILEYAEGTDGIYQCLLNKNKKDLYYSKDINKYCSVLCKEGYKFNVPTKTIVNSGRSFKIDMELESANVQCYLTTAKQTFLHDYISNNVQMQKAYNDYQLLKLTNCDSMETEEERISCEESKSRNVTNYIKQLTDGNDNLDSYIALYKKCIDASETIVNTKDLKTITSMEWNADSNLTYSYKEPIKETNSNKKYSKQAGDDSSYDQKNSNTYNTANSAYCDGTFNNLKDKAKRDVDCVSPATSVNRHYYRCDIVGDSANCKYDTEITIDPYVRWSQETSSKVSYETKRVYYTEAGSGNIKVFKESDTKPADFNKKYSVVDGLPVAYDTPEGKYTYDIILKQVGINGRVSDKLKNISSNKYVCSYTVDEQTPPNNKPEYCVQTTDSTSDQYLCESEVYFAIKKANPKTKAELNTLLNNNGYLIGENPKCRKINPAERDCVNNSYNYNCDTSRIGRKCTSTVYNAGLDNQEDPTSSGQKIYDIEYRTITSSNINPTDRDDLGFNWNVNNANSLVARKALDTINYISYRSKAAFEQASGAGITDSNLNEFGQANTTIVVNLDSEALEYLKDLDITASTLECYDYIDDSITEEDACKEKAYDWVDGKCVAENIFCYSSVIDKLVDMDKVDSSTTRPRAGSRSDIKSSNFTGYTKNGSTLSDELGEEISSLDYIPVQKTKDTNAVDSKYYTIESSNETQDYWTVYNFVTLDVNNDGSADIGPSWR